MAAEMIAGSLGASRDPFAFTTKKRFPSFNGG